MNCLLTINNDINAPAWAHGSEFVYFFGQPASVSDQSDACIGTKLQADIKLGPKESSLQIMHYMFCKCFYYSLDTEPT